MHNLERLRPVVQPGVCLEGEHEGVDGGGQEVKAQGPEGKVGKEAERLANGGFALLNLV